MAVFLGCVSQSNPILSSVRTKSPGVLPCALYVMNPAAPSEPQAVSTGAPAPPQPSEPQAVSTGVPTQPTESQAVPTGAPAPPQPSEPQAVPTGAPSPPQPTAQHPPAYAVHSAPGASQPSPYSQVPMPPENIPFQMPVQMPPSRVDPQYPPEMQMPMPMPGPGPVSVSVPVPVPMPTPEKPAGCPPGLEYLTQFTHMLVEDQTPPRDLFQVCCGLANANRYAVKDTSGRAVFHVQEEGDGGYKSVFGPGRPYVMHVTDNYEREIITLRQTLISNLEILSPPGIPIGYISSSPTFHPRITIYNETRQPVLKIIGPPWLPFRFCGKIDFQITLPTDHRTIDGNAIGNISRMAYGKYDVQFPAELGQNVTIKAAILGACVLIDIGCFHN